MRISSYNIGAPIYDQASFILLHGLTGAVDKLSFKLGNLLVTNRNCILQNDLGIPDETLRYLASRGYITNLTQEEENEKLVSIAVALHTNDLEDTAPAFMFVPTYQCNLRCPYCFQSHEMHKGVNQFSAILTSELVDQAFKIIDQFNYQGSLAYETGIIKKEKLNKEGGTNKIGLFGGEPLMEVTKDIVNYIINNASDRGLSVTAITNGVELGNFYDVLEVGKLDELQITLDGTSRLHDRRRIGPGFKKTFDIISENIEYALNKGIKISLRMNVDAANAAELCSLNDYCITRGWNKYPRFSAHAAAVTPDKSTKNIMTKAELTSLTMKLSANNESVFYSYEKVAREALQNALINDGYTFKGVANCSAETGLLMFDALGDVYSCWEEIGEVEKKVGTYDVNGIHFNDALVDKWLSRFPGTIAECIKCPYALIHNSGCAKHAEDFNGSVYSSACESFQAYFPTTLSKAYMDLENLVLHS